MLVYQTVTNMIISLLSHPANGGKKNGTFFLDSHFITFHQFLQRGEQQQLTLEILEDLFLTLQNLAQNVEQSGAALACAAGLSSARAVTKRVQELKVM